MTRDKNQRNKYTYTSYISSPIWKNKRESILKRDKHQCQTCMGKESLQVHHKTYDRLFKEKQSDLITLCSECHDAITNVFRERRYELKVIELSSVQRLTPTKGEVIKNGIQKIELSDCRRVTPTYA